VIAAGDHLSVRIAGPQGYAMKQKFTQIVDRITHLLGTPGALATATLVILVWAITGPLFGFSDTWQLVINTSTTIVTFLMVFVIQNAQNRDAKAVHIKLDELLRAAEGASNRFVVAENLTEEEQDKEIKRLVKVAKRQDRQPTAKEAVGVVDAPKATPAKKTQRSRSASSSTSRAG
jgi:low affinity Fe/Cu permease